MFVTSDLSMRLIFLGCPGAGKGTQSQYLQAIFGIPHISLGSMLRAVTQSDTLQGLEIQKILDAGNFVSDEMAIELLKVRLEEPDCQNGFILDGFPRNLAQAKALEEMGIGLDYVIVLDVDEAEVIRRLSGRLVHPASGRTYHLIHNPPKTEGKDDVTGEPLMQRDDDKEEVTKKRFEVYQAQTEILLEYYRNKAQSGTDNAPKYIEVNVTGTTEQVRDRILERLQEDKLMCI